MHLLQIVALSLALVLVANSFPLNSPEDNAWVEATWLDFKTRHIVTDSGHASRNKAQWNALLKDRVGSNYGSSSRTINSFLITTEDDIKRDIKGATLKHDKAGNLFWSNDMYTVYVMKLPVTGIPYNTYRCRNLYFLTGVDNLTSKIPVHYEAQSAIRRSSGTFPLDPSCVIVN